MRAAQDKHGAKWLRVITSDREIRRYAERHKISSMSSMSPSPPPNHMQASNRAPLNP